MAGGGAAPIGAAGRAEEYKGTLTWYVIFVAIVAASGGLLFGYDLGVTGGVESMDSFLSQFFPSIYEEKQADSNNYSPYCVFNDNMLSLFTSSLFIAGLFASLVASQVTRWYGRKWSMLIGGLWFLAGGILNAAAQDLAMLIVGRIFLGFGIGFANSSVPMYLSEMAPHNYRGASSPSWSTMGAKEGRAVLEKIRGTVEVDAEFDDISEAAESAKKISQPQAWKNILTKKEYRPSLVLAIAIPTFQQWTGINAIMFYVPVLFSSMGSGKQASLLNAVIIGAVNLCSTFVSIYLVDRAGRRKLFLEGGIQMLIAQARWGAGGWNDCGWELPAPGSQQLGRLLLQPNWELAAPGSWQPQGLMLGLGVGSWELERLIIVGVVLGVEFGKYDTQTLPESVAIGVLVVICVFVAGFAWSWGPLGWLVPSEVQPLETRAAGFALATSVNFLFSFVLGLSFLPMLCSMEYGVFLFFAGFVMIMTVFVFFLVPETKGVPLEEIFTTVSHEFSLTELGAVGAKGAPGDAKGAAEQAEDKEEKLEAERQETAREEGGAVRHTPKPQKGEESSLRQTENPT
eukprot:scaffold16.g118.t1